MMPILVKGDDIRSGTKANAHHGQSVTVTISSYMYM